MHAFCVTIVLAALTALTAAAPHAIGHAHFHGGISKISMIAGRSALEGACGGATGDMCQPGYCCSQWGYCGQGDQYCGAGCNSAFGDCGSTQTSAHATTMVVQSTISVSALPVSSSIEFLSTGGEATKFHPGPVRTTATDSPPESTSVAETSVAQATSTAAPPSSVVASTSDGAAPTIISSATSSATGGSGSGSGSDAYKTYTGDGSTSAGWPSEDAWVDFDSMWSANLKVISVSCTQFGQDNNSDQESDDLKSAIQSIASSSGIDERFILAVVMQESKGCVRAPTTNYGVRNPGLMQDHDGAGTCNDASVSNPCPQSEIQQMIKDGTTGTAAGDGLEQCMAQSGASDVSKYYKAARIYNSGSVTQDNLSLGVATHCYASDIANRLTGWVNAATSCTL